MLLPIALLPLLMFGFYSLSTVHQLVSEKIELQNQSLKEAIQSNIKSTLEAGKAQLEFLPQAQILNRYLSMVSNEEKNQYIAPMVQLLFHQAMMSNKNIQQIVLTNQLDYEEIQVGDGINPFSQRTDSNQTFLKKMKTQGENEYNQLIKSTETNQYVYKQGITFQHHNPELLISDTTKQEKYSLIITSTLKSLSEFIKQQEEQLNYKIVLYQNEDQTSIEARYSPLDLKKLLGTDKLRLDGLQYQISDYLVTPKISMLILIPEQIVQAQISDTQTTLLVLIAASALMLSILTNWLANRLIASPINDLSKLIHQVTDQKIHHIPLVAPHNEISELRNQFAIMVSRLEASQTELEHSIYIDPLTGLYNRSAFINFLQKKVFTAKQENGSFFITQLKLHNLSGINNTFGSKIGDKALQAISKILSDLIKKAHHDKNSLCTLARIGSDEFCFVLPSHDKFNPVSAPQLCEQLARRLKRPVLVGDYELRLKFSAGIVSYPEAGSRVEDLLQSANQARHQASRYSGNYWYLLDGVIAARLREDKWLESELGSAIAQQQLRVVFQPQYSLKKQLAIGAEVLLRWHHPEYGSIPPDRFIPIAEHSAQILDIDLWVLEQACRCQAKLQASGFDRFHLAVNASATELSNPHYPQQVAKLLDKYHLDPTYFGVEITETALVELDDVARDMVITLKKVGVEIALDDFGTGYTSLNHLVALPLDMLKIDRTYTAQLEDNPKLVDSILQLAEAFGLRVIAEGVETKEQLHHLMAKGCDQAQGYLLSRPITEDALMNLLCGTPDPTPWQSEFSDTNLAALPRSSGQHIVTSADYRPTSGT